MLCMTFYVHKNQDSYSWFMKYKHQFKNYLHSKLRAANKITREEKIPEN